MNLCNPQSIKSEMRVAKAVQRLGARNYPGSLLSPLYSRYMSSNAKAAPEGPTPVEVPTDKPAAENHYAPTDLTHDQLKALYIEKFRKNVEDPDPAADVLYNRGKRETLRVAKDLGLEDALKSAQAELDRAQKVADKHGGVMPRATGDWKSGGSGYGEDGGSSEWSAGRIGGFLFFGATTVLLASFGVWQLRRRSWKQNLIEFRHEQLDRDPQPLGELHQSLSDGYKADEKVHEIIKSLQSTIITIVLCSLTLDCYTRVLPNQLFLCIPTNVIVCRLSVDSLLSC